MCVISDTFIPDSDVGPHSDKSETATIPFFASKRKPDVVEIDSERNMSLKYHRISTGLSCYMILKVCEICFKGFVDIQKVR